MRIQMSMTLLLVSIIVTGCSLQQKLLYYPERHVPGDSELARYGLRFWPSGRDGYRGFIGAMPEERRKGTVVVLHGNAATAAERRYYLEPLRRLGYRVLLAEYPGYGGRKGELSEKSFVRDARESIRLTAEMYGRPIYLLGESLGGAVAASAVREAGAGVEGIILVTPWDTLEGVAKEKYPFLPVCLLMTDRYDTAANLSAFRGTVAVVAAERDTIIPPHHAEKLYRSFGGRKRFWTIPDAGHNDWPDSVTDGIWEEIMEFITAGSVTGAGK
jgi:uncharacterized protein